LTTPISDYGSLRLISRILMLYYAENHSQAEIGRMLNLSTAKVNRLLKQARAEGMVEIKIHTPFEHLTALEKELEDVSGLKQAIVVPHLVENSDATLQSVGEAAAAFLLSQLREGDTICIGGGRALYTLVNALVPDKKHNVEVVPAIGGVQGRYNTDVNSLAAELAYRLGGTYLQLHAPAFTDSQDECETLYSMRQVKEVLGRAAQAQIALVGIGAVQPEDASYFQFTSMPDGDIKRIVEEDCAVGEILAHVYNAQGELCSPQYAQRVVGLSPKLIKKIPLSIGLAALEDKVLPVAAALRAGYLNVLVTDEVTAKAIIETLKQNI